MNFDNLTSPRKSIHRDNLRREDFLVYGVTDRHWLQEGERLPDVVRKALDGGATFIQLREKQLDEADFMAEALEIPVCHQRQRENRGGNRRRRCTRGTVGYGGRQRPGDPRR